MKIGGGADHIAEKLGLWYKVETIKEHPATLLDTTKIQGTNFIEFSILNILFEVDQTIPVLLYFRNRNSHSGRTFITGSTKTHLQETMLMVLTKKECEDLGAYKSKNSNKTIKVKSDVELCAASVSTKRSPERWIKVHSNSGEDAGKKFTYEKAKEYDHSVLKTSFYGGKVCM